MSNDPKLESDMLTCPTKITYFTKNIQTNPYKYPTTIHFSSRKNPKNLWIPTRFQVPPRSISSPTVLGLDGREHGQEGGQEATHQDLEVTKAVKALSESESVDRKILMNTII